MANLELPLALEPFRDKLEATVKPYIEIQTRLTRKASLWKSKFAGFPYLPKNFDYPKTSEGDYLYLLAQINFEDTPYLEGFPQKGILQFYLAKTDLYAYGLDFDNPTSQRGFRILFFPEPDLEEENLLTDFDFLPSLWNRDYNIPFYLYSSYTPHRNDCFALSFSLKSAPISSSDYQFDKLIGSEIESVLSENEFALWDEYHENFEQGHRLGGYPDFTQGDIREFLPEEEEPYILLLQIDSDSRASEKIDIQWGDCGVGNFFIKESALKRLDFSEVLYNWDCS